MGAGASLGVQAAIKACSPEDLQKCLAGLDPEHATKIRAALSPPSKVKIYGMPPSMNACGPIVLSLDLGIGEFALCDLMSGAHKKPEHLAIHPYGQIPAMKDGDFGLGESNAILRYLALAYGQKYYPPTAPQVCAKIDFAMDAFSLVYKAHVNVVYPVMGFGAAPADQAAASTAYTEAITKWLDIHVKDGKFVTGDCLSIADFKAAPFFYAALQPVIKEKTGFEPPARMVQYCNSFFGAVGACKFMQEAGGFSIKEYIAGKGAATDGPAMSEPGSVPAQAPKYDEVAAGGGGVKYKDHPTYAKAFEWMDCGMPRSALEAKLELHFMKMGMDVKDFSFLDTPDAIVKAKLKVYQMPPSMNACGPTVLSMDLGVGEPELCDLMSSAHKKPEHVAIHPYGQIPAMKDGDFCLGESNAILRYLANAYGQKYYPTSSPQTCAKIDFAMDAFSMVYACHVKVVYPVMGFGEAPADQPAASAAYLEALNKWLDIHVNNGKFVTGDSLSIADFKAAPFFYAAMQPAIKKKTGFEAPPRLAKYCEDFMAAAPASKFMQEAGGFSIKEFLASKEA